MSPAVMLHRRARARRTYQVPGVSSGRGAGTPVFGGRWEMGVLFYVTWSERASLLAGAEGVREEGRRDYSLQSWGAVK